MYTVANLHTFLEGQNVDLMDFHLTKDVMGGGTEVTFITRHDSTWLEPFKSLEIGKTSIRIPGMLDKDEDMQRYIESKILFHLGKYDGPLQIIEMSLHDKLSMWNKKGPVLFKDPYASVTYIIPGSHIEQYYVGGYHMYMHLEGDDNIIVPDFNKEISDYTLLGGLPIPYNIYKNPSNKHVHDLNILLDSPDCYWGQDIYYNPVFKDQMLAKVSEEVWIQTTITELLSKAKGSMLDEVNLVVGMWDV